MEILITAIVVGFIVALASGYLFGWHVCRKDTARLEETARLALRRFRRNQAIDLAQYLATLRRELANVMIWRDPQRFLQFYRELHSDVSSVRSLLPEKAEARLDELNKKYPNYHNFDGVGTLDYVLYADSLSSRSYEELEERYRDIVMHAALSAIAVEHWRDAAEDGFVHTTGDAKLDHLTEYVQKIEDTKLKLRLEKAVEYNDVHRYADGAINHYDDLSNDFYHIKRLEHFAESRIGIHLKRTDEYGIFSVFHGDDRSYESYYRSDATFTMETWLDFNSLPGILEAAHILDEANLSVRNSDHVGRTVHAA